MVSPTIPGGNASERSASWAPSAPPGSSRTRCGGNTRRIEEASWAAIAGDGREVGWIWMDHNMDMDMAMDMDFGMRIFHIFSPKYGITRYLMGRNFLRMVKNGQWALALLVGLPCWSYINPKDLQL